MRIVLIMILCSAGAVSPVPAGPVISEFMAGNQNGLTDESGNRPDWIEIRNQGGEPVSLAGWALTDSASHLQKWIFPAVTLPGEGYLIVFASSEDRRVPGQNLHANFSLSTSGEYLALVRPDGTVAMDWGASYPKQYPNISYGTAVNSVPAAWVGQDSPVRAHVPPDTALIPQWRTAGFDDTSWTAGTFGVGYMNADASPNLSGDLGLNLGATVMNGSGRHSYTRTVFTVEDHTKIAGIKLRVNYDDGFAAWINGTLAASSPGTPTADPISPTALVAGHPPEGYEDFFLRPEAAAALVSGANVLAIENFNSSAGSSDAFVSARLEGTVILPGDGLSGYFTRATPGAVNGSDAEIQLPLDVTYSRPPGTFTEAFSLTMSGAGQGQEIRYIIADPSALGAAVEEPTAASALYTGPVTVSSSKLIRAAVFQGQQKGRTTTAQYLLLQSGSSNNTSNFTSQLPIVVMDDHGDGQPVDSNTGSWTTTLMHVFRPADGVARLDGGGEGDASFFARCGTRVRGSSSAGFPKKSYAVEFRNEQDGDAKYPLLGMAADSDWILNGPYEYDDTFIHNAFISEVSRRIGRWAPRTQPVEVFFNQNGGRLDYQDYAGVYILTEKIKTAEERLEISHLQPGDSTGTALTGGYIFKIDRPDSGEYAWSISNSAFGLGTLPNSESGQKLILVEPDADFDTAAQQDYLRNTAVLSWNNALFADRAAGFTSRNYRSHIDVRSFVDHHLLNSLAYNVDALRLSAYFHKDRNGKIQAGPIWDFDRSMGSDDGRDSNPASWSNISYFFDRDWWYGLFRDPQFVQEVVDRWWELRQPGKPFETAQLQLLADAMGSEIGPAAAARDAAKWPANAASGGKYLNEISALKTWLASRGTFIDNAAPRPPEASAGSGPVEAGTAVTLSGSGTIRYTLDGSDPRPYGGGPPGAGSVYSTPLVIQSTTVLAARRQGTFTPFPGGAAPISWSAPQRRVWLVNESFAKAGDLSVSEINYHPLPPTPAEAAAVPGVDAEDFEWIELRNTGTHTVNTFEMEFPAEAPFESAVTLAPVSMAPGAHALLVKNRAAFEARYGTSFGSIIAGEWTEGSLDNGGEQIRLLARDGTLIAAFRYQDKDGWPDRADGRGSSLEYTGGAFESSDYGKAGNWRSSSELHGSPGAAGTGPEMRVVINELLTHATSPRVDAIELRNNSSAPVDAGGWFLSDAGDPESVLDYQKFSIPGGTVIPPGGYAVFTEAAFNPNGLWNTAAGNPGANEFSLDGRHGGEVWLVSSTGGRLRFVDNAEFESSLPDESWGRLPNGTGPFEPMLNRTLLDETGGTVPLPGLGRDNSGIRVGPLFIQEIQHAPETADRDLQFVEIFNSAATAVSLTNWRLRGDVDYDFLTEEIPPGGVLVIVPFSPADAARAGYFRSTYAIDDSVVLAGPWDPGDHLESDGRVVLYRAGPPPVDEPGFIPRTQEDVSEYLSGSGGWPATGGGVSLNRVLADYGSSPSSWTAGVPSPGRVGMPYAYWSSLEFPPGSPLSESTGDPDNDGLTNLLEYAFGAAPRAADPASVLPAVAVENSGNAMVFRYTKRRDRPGLTCTVQRSADLQSWSSVADSLAGVSGNLETRMAAVTVTPGTSIYLRLRVSVPP